MGRYLFRGVSVHSHEENRGRLLPKKPGYFSYPARFGEARYGSWTYGSSDHNAVIKHQLGQAGFPDSGISTTPVFERAVFYATEGGKQEIGFVYVIDRESLESFEVKEFVVARHLKDPSVPEDEEVILVAHDGGELPCDIIVRILEVKPDEKHPPIVETGS